MQGKIRINPMTGRLEMEIDMGGFVTPEIKPLQKVEFLINGQWTPCKIQVTFRPEYSIPSLGVKISNGMIARIP